MKARQTSTLKLYIILIVIELIGVILIMKFDIIDYDLKFKYISQIKHNIDVSEAHINCFRCNTRNIVKRPGKVIQIDINQRRSDILELIDVTICNLKHLARKYFMIPINDFFLHDFCLFPKSK